MMDKVDKEAIMWVVLTIVIIATIVGGLVYWMDGVIDSVTPDEYITVEGTIIDSKTVLDADGRIDYLILTFDSGITYLIDPGWGETDLTVNSKVILELGKEYEDNVWEIQRIIKVPD